jgi:hypothetical protein
MITYVGIMKNITDLSRIFWLIIGPALYIWCGSRCSSGTSVSFSSIARHLYPLLRRREIVLIVPILLSGSICTSLSTKSRVLWNTFDLMGSGVTIDRSSSSGWFLNLRKASICNCRITLDRILSNSRGLL